MENILFCDFRFSFPRESLFPWQIPGSVLFYYTRNHYLNNRLVFQCHLLLINPNFHPPTLENGTRWSYCVLFLQLLCFISTMYCECNQHIVCKIHSVYQLWNEHPCSGSLNNLRHHLDTCEYKKMVVCFGKSLTLTLHIYHGCECIHKPANI